MSSHIKAVELRKKTQDQLIETVNELKKELSQLRVAKVSGQGGPSKLAKIKVVRKSIARTLTVHQQKLRDALRQEYRKRSFKPLDLRTKKTRAIRRRLSVKHATAKTERTKKRESNFPIRKYAVKA